MAFVFRQQYEPHVEERMRDFFETLNEKDQRRFAALEVERLRQKCEEGHSCLSLAT
jgi:hypothetical protein